MKPSISRELRFAVITALGVAAAAAGTAAHAQQSGAGAQLEEIVVTARKTTETLQEAPVAVAAFTAEQIDQRQLTSINDVARFAPGLVFDKAFGRTTDRPVIRGQGNVLAGVQAGVEAGAAYFIDGVYYPGGLQTLDMNDVERVEVIRGPQSALYGRNTYSGAINFVTKRPSAEFRARGKVSADQDQKTVSFGIEGPISETIGARLSILDDRFDGQWTNEVTKEKIGQERTTAISGTLAWNPSEDLSVRLRGSYNKDRDGTRPFWFQGAIDNNCFPGTRSISSYQVTVANPALANPNQYYCGALRTRPIYANDGLAIPAPFVDPSRPVGLLNVPAGTQYNPGPGIAFSGVNRNLRFWSGVADWNIAGSGWTLTADGGFRREDLLAGSDSDFVSQNVLSPTAPAGTEATSANTSGNWYRDFSFELRLSSPTDRALRGMLGVFYYEQEDRLFDINFNAPGGFGKDRASQISDLYNKAVFGLVEWKFLDDWSVTAEVRNAEETKQSQNFMVGVTGVVGASTFYGKDSWKKTTPRATLKWQATPDLNLYAIYAEGIKPGGFNGAGGLAFNASTYLPETSKNYELGVKAAWLDGRLVTNVALYRIDSEQIQLTTAVAGTATPNAVASLVTNQGEGRVTGVELESRLKVNEFLTVGLNYALADSEFTKGCDDFQWQLTSGGGNNPNRPGAFNPANPAAGGTNLNGQGNCSIVGNQFPLSAKHTGALTADWLSPIGGTGLDFYVNASHTYTGKRFVQVHNLAYVPAAKVTDLRFGVQAETWSAGFYGRNLFDEDAPPVATRWFDYGYGPFFVSQAFIPGVTQLKAALPYPTSVAAYAGPRGFFGGFRRERQLGVEATFKFGGASKPAPAAAPLAAAAPVVAAAPPAPPPDGDGDGVIDANDRCPGTPAGANVDASGCELDSDADGVVDRLDKCPGTPTGIKVDAVGCEIEEIVLRGVQFDTNQATLKDSSVAILDGVVALLQKRPGAKVEIRGYTDSVGRDAYNRTLSEKRAQAVVDYLVSKGIPAGNLSANGLGEADPIAPNDTPEGREQNRRVTLQFATVAAK